MSAKLRTTGQLFGFLIAMDLVSAQACIRIRAQYARVHGCGDSPRPQRVCGGLLILSEDGAVAETCGSVGER